MNHIYIYLPYKKLVKKTLTERHIEFHTGHTLMFPRWKVNVNTKKKLVWVRLDFYLAMLQVHNNKIPLFNFARKRGPGTNRIPIALHPSNDKEIIFSGGRWMYINEPYKTPDEIMHGYPMETNYNIIQIQF